MQSSEKLMVSEIFQDGPTDKQIDQQTDQWQLLRTPSGKLGVKKENIVSILG